MQLRIALVLLVFPIAAHADFEMRFSDGTVGLVHDGAVLLGNDESAILYRPEDEGLVVISREERSWLHVGEDFDKAVAAQMKAEQEQILASVPPEQRAMVEEQMQGMVRPESQQAQEVVVRRTGSTALVAGYECEEAEIMFAGGAAEEVVCIATARELGIGKRDFESLNAATRRVADIFSVNVDDSPNADLVQMGGIPIRTHDLPLGDVSEMTFIENAPIDGARLQIPDGFTEITLEDMLQF